MPRSTFILLIALLTCGATNRIFSQDVRRPSNVSELKLGQDVEGELKRGQSLSHTVTLKAGQYINVTVKCTTSVVEDVLDPNGNEVGKLAPGDMGPTDSLWIVAETTGEFRIQIKAVENEPAQCSTRLEKLGEFKSAPASDQTYVRAHRLFWEAAKLSDQGGDQSFHQAGEKYQGVLALWRELGDRLGEASTLQMLGYVYDHLNAPQKSVDSYEQALSIWRTLPKTKQNQQDQATALYNLGGIYSGTGKTPEAIKCYQESIELRRLLGTKGGLGYSFNNLGQAYVNVGDFQAALKSFQEALRLRIETGDIEAQARTLSNISGVYFRLGEFQEALNYCKQALPLRRAAKDQRGESITLSNIGSNYRELGEPQRALEYYQQAVLVMRAKGDRINEAGVLDAIAQAYYDLGDYPKALEYQNQSLSLRQTIIDQYGVGSSLANLGNVYARMGNRQKALEYFEQSLALRRTTGDRRGEAMVLQNAGVLYLEMGDSQKARAYFDDGLAISRAIKNRYLEANLLYDLARLEKGAGQLDQARAQVESAIGVVESMRARVASSDLRASFFASKQDFYELEIDLLMQPDRGERGQEDLIKAFHVSEQRRARSLFDSLEQAQANIHRVLSPELVARERDLRAKLNEKAENQIKLLSGKHTPEQADALENQVSKASTEYEQVLAEIATSDPHYAGLTRAAPLNLSEFQREILDPDTMLLEYSLGSERSYLWAITPTNIAAYELPAREDIEKRARNVYGLLTERNRFIKFETPDERQARIGKADAEYVSAAGQLSRILLGPIAEKLGGKRLLIVSDGALQYLPFSALPAPIPGVTTRELYRPLIADHEVTNLPSASILGTLRREVSGRKPAPKTVAVLADPVFSKTDERVTARASVRRSEQPINSHQSVRGADAAESELVRAVRDVGGENGLDIDRLPSTRQEAAAILKLVPRTDQFKALDFRANRATAISPELSQYRIVHFATHGLLNTTHPGLSGLILSLVDRQGNDQDGFLSTQEVFDLNLPADLVVLSGCRTGLGKDIRGEGMQGLARGFMYAGAARVAVSLWDVNDQSTAELMARFYQGMLGKKSLSPAAALRDAQLQMWKSNGGREPYYWAAFVIEGEYR